MRKEKTSVEDAVLILLDESLGNGYEIIGFGTFQKLLHKYKDKSPLLRNILFDTNGGQPHSIEIDEALGALMAPGLLEVDAMTGYRLTGAAKKYMNEVKSKFSGNEFDNLKDIGKEIKKGMKKYN